MKYKHRLIKDLDIPQVGRNFKKGYTLAITDDPEKLKQYSVRGENDKESKWAIINSEHVRLEACAE